MNPLIKKTSSVLLVASGLVCFGLSPAVRAVSPPPDGGYPGGNTAEGQAALLSLTSGGYNTAVGYLCLRSNATDSFNTAIGAGALLADTAAANTATGAAALLSNTTGGQNTANGAFTLFSNTTGDSNTAVGFQSLFHNNVGTLNTAVGQNVLLGNTTGNFNTAVGGEALESNTTGYENTAIGYQALMNCSGAGNTAVGYLAGQYLTSGQDNIDIGADGELGDAGVIRIGRSFINATYIAGIFERTNLLGIEVFIDQYGKLGTSTSSARFKDDIKPMDKASETIFALKPVTFHYKKEIDPARRPQFGLVAEEVDKVKSDLVVRDKEGKPYSVRYDQVNAMLLNEFLKEHKAFVEEQRKVQKLEATVAKQRKDFEAAVGQMTAQIRKVSAQLEVRKPAPKVAENNK
jgi:hypothetical protein